MANRIDKLERLATEEVGKNGSTLIFVSEDGTIRAVFTDLDDMDAAIEFASSLPRRHAVVIENHEGVAWENEESERRQQEEDEDEDEDDEEDEDD